MHSRGTDAGNTDTMHSVVQLKALSQQQIKCLSIFVVAIEEVDFVFSR